MAAHANPAANAREGVVPVENVKNLMKSQQPERHPARAAFPGNPFGWRFTAPLMLGSTLNPINSSLMATALVGMSLLVGIANGCSGVGNQTSLFVQSPADDIAVASGLLRTAPYMGAISLPALSASPLDRGPRTVDSTSWPGLSAA